MRPKPARPIRPGVSDHSVPKNPNLPPTTPPAMAPPWDDLFDAEDELDEAIPDCVLVGDPVAGAVPVDSGASARNTCQAMECLRYGNATHLYLFPPQ